MQNGQRFRKTRIYSFPGSEMTTYETINNIKYYKIALPASKVWDQSLNFLICNGDFEGNWKTSDFTSAVFSGKKNEYFFNVAGTTIEQLSGRPEPISISINGSFNDWAYVAGNSFANSGKTTIMKAFATDTNLYVYLNMKNDNGDNMTYDNNNSYFRLYFDTDNDSSNGFESSNWIYGGADYLDSGSSMKTILAYYYKSDSLNNACFRGYDGGTDILTATLTSAGATIKAVDDGANGVLVELMIPLSIIETIPANTHLIKIFSVGSGNYYGKLPGVRLP